MTDRLITLSCRDVKGLELDTLGPFLEVIFRPGSNWIEVQDLERNWQTISGAHYARVLVVTRDAGDTPIPEPIDYSGGW